MERKGDKQKTLAIEYKKYDDKQENLDNSQSRKTKEPSVEDVSNLDVQFDTQVTNKVSDIDLSNQQEFE